MSVGREFFWSSRRCNTTFKCEWRSEVCSSDISGLTLIFSLSRLQVSPELQQSKGCLLSDVMADARVQAQTLADAAGLAVRPIVALSGRRGGQALAGGFDTPSLRGPPLAPPRMSIV